MQGQAQPPGFGVDSIPPGRGGMGMGGGVEATPPSRRVRMQQRQHKDGGGRRAEKVESQVKKPKGHPGGPSGQGAASRW